MKLMYRHYNTLFHHAQEIIVIDCMQICMRTTLELFAAGYLRRTYSDSGFMQTHKGIRFEFDNRIKYKLWTMARIIKRVFDGLWYRITAGSKRQKPWPM